MLVDTSHEITTVKHQAVTADHLLKTLAGHEGAVVLDHCTSASWRDIGNVLASVRQLPSLALLHCDIDSSFCR